MFVDEWVYVHLQLPSLKPNGLPLKVLTHYFSNPFRFLIYINFLLPTAHRPLPLGNPVFSFFISSINARYLYKATVSMVAGWHMEHIFPTCFMKSSSMYKWSYRGFRRVFTTERHKCKRLWNFGTTLYIFFLGIPLLFSQQVFGKTAKTFVPCHAFPSPLVP